MLATQTASELKSNEVITIGTKHSEQGILFTEVHTQFISNIETWETTT
jgi:hypothetical protein